ERLRAQAESVADRLRDALLPPIETRLGPFDVDVFHAPADRDDRIGGDFFDVVVQGDHAVLVIGDVVGHGLAAANQMAMVRAMLRTTVATVGTDPDRVLATANSIFEQVCGVGAPFATVALATVGLTDGGVRVATAGHPRPVVRHCGGAHSVSVVPGPPLGVVPEATYHVGSEDFGPGDWLALFTDGVFERRDQPIDESIEAVIVELDEHVTAASIAEAASSSRTDGRRTDDDRVVLLIRGR
ncbi:MAG: PP2C family protein-serine/threonine phosphatase, partial [Actinomycetota bacterium]